MLSNRTLDELRRFSSYIEKGVIEPIDQLTGLRLAHLARTENIDELMEILPVELYPNLKEGLLAYTERMIGEDHLRPEESVFMEHETGYDSWLARLLLKPVDEYLSRLAMVCAPSFQVEWAIRVCRHTEFRRLPDPLRSEIAVLTVAAQQIYSAPDITSVPIEVNQCFIDHHLTRRLVAVWDHMLQQTRYPEQGGPGLDGVTYHFSNGTMAGTTWSPDSDTAPGKLVEVGYALRKLIQADESAKESAVVHLDRCLDALMPEE